MKHFLILVMIISLLTASVFGCSNGLVSHNGNDLSSCNCTPPYGGSYSRNIYEKYCQMEKDIIEANNDGVLSILINRTDKKLIYGEKYQFKTLKEMWHFIKKQTFA
jgi:hypothetical protein